MYEERGEGWKAESQTEARFYRRRKPIWDLVEWVAKRRKIPEDEAAAVIDHWCHAHNIMSLNVLSKSTGRYMADERGEPHN